MRAGGGGSRGEESPIRVGRVVGFEWRPVRVVVERNDKEAEGEEVACRGEGVVDGEIGGGKVEAVLDVGGKTWVKGGRGRGGDGGDCEGEGGEFPVGLRGGSALIRGGGSVLMEGMNS